jgi:hypothetical protein
MITARYDKTTRNQIYDPNSDTASTALGVAGGTGAAASITAVTLNGVVQGSASGLTFPSVGQTNVYTITRAGVTTTLTLTGTPQASSPYVMVRNQNGVPQTRTITYDANIKPISDTGWI